MVIWKYITLTVCSKLCGDWWWRMALNNATWQCWWNTRVFNHNDVRKGRRSMMVWRCYGPVMHNRTIWNELGDDDVLGSGSVEGKRSHLQVDGWVDHDTLKGGSKRWELHGGVWHNEQPDAMVYRASSLWRWGWELIFCVMGGCGAWWLGVRVRKFSQNSCYSSFFFSSFPLSFFQVKKAPEARKKSPEMSEIYLLCSIYCDISIYHAF